jgi:hypothetical protein
MHFPRSDFWALPGVCYPFDLFQQSHRLTTLAAWRLLQEMQPRRGRRRWSSLAALHPMTIRRFRRRRRRPHARASHPAYRRAAVGWQKKPRPTQDGVPQCEGHAISICTASYSSVAVSSRTVDWRKVLPGHSTGSVPLIVPFAHASAGILPQNTRLLCLTPRSSRVGIPPIIALCNA